MSKLHGISLHILDEMVSTYRLHNSKSHQKARTCTKFQNTYLNGVNVSSGQGEWGSGAKYPHPDRGNQRIGDLTQLLDSNSDQRIECSLTSHQGLAGCDAGTVKGSANVNC